MNKIVLALLFLFANSTWLRAEIKEPVYPTTQEILKDCKSAAAAADAGNQKVFLHSNCTALIFGFLLGQQVATQAVPLPSDNGEGQNIYNEYAEHINKRLCLINNLMSNVSMEKRLELVVKNYIEIIESEIRKNPAILRESGAHALLFYRYAELCNI